VIGVNRTGKGGGTEYCVESMTFDPWGDRADVVRDEVFLCTSSRRVRETFLFLRDMA
jgi:hypothetical protein